MRYLSPHVLIRLLMTEGGLIVPHSHTHTVTHAHARAPRYLMSRSIVHGDLKLQNCLACTAPNARGFSVKIAGRLPSSSAQALAPAAAPL